MFFKKLLNKGYEAEECEICYSPFKLIKFDRIHKCKRCLKFICYNCGDTKQQVIDDEGRMTPDRHRVCVKCKSDIQLIRDSIEYYELRWAHNSKLSKEWLTGLRRQYQIDYEYEHFLNYYFRAGSRFDEQTQIIDKDVIRGRTDFSVFNYSMKQFFYTVQLQVEDQQTTRRNIANVLYAVAARFDKVGYCQGMSGIAAFLLCFADEETAYVIFCDLLEHIFPQKFFERSSFGVSLIGLLAQIYFLKEYYQHYISTVKKSLLLKEREAYSEEEIGHIKVVIQLAGTKALLSIFIGILNFSNLLFVWEELKQHRSFEVVEKAFLAIIYLNRNAILQERSFKRLEEYFQKLDSQSFREAYHDIQVDQSIKEKFIAQFYEENAKKWNSSGAGSAYTLSKVTHLTQAQVKYLQKHFCSSFAGQDMIKRIVISDDEFVKLVETYYSVLKQESAEGQSILQINPYFVRKILKGYSLEGSGLLFREFVCCFSVCTKSKLKERICAIVSTFGEGQQNVEADNFEKLMLGIVALSPPQLDLAKCNFLERAKKFFEKRSGSAKIEQIEILLNDEFIFQMSQIISFEIEQIIAKTLVKYDSVK